MPDKDNLGKHIVYLICDNGFKNITIDFEF